MSGPICGQMYTSECPFNLEMQDDKTVQKLAAVIKKRVSKPHRDLWRDF
ncbi:hypothetical protein [Campylobacter sp.]|nr:hypothetical protein [Campylobacter sp.]MDY4153961.1 hypothetical protein [Campylobacter sp.]